MDYTSRSRDRFRWAATGVSGLVTTAALVGTGALAGQMAAAQHTTDAARQQRQAEEYAAWRAQQAAYDARIARLHADPRVILRHRPERTRVTTRYTTAAPTTVTVSSHSSGGSSSSGGGSAGSSTHHTAPPPPPPPPAPATHGS